MPIAPPLRHRSPATLLPCCPATHPCYPPTAHPCCRSLLLSDAARVDVAPTLEIDTDDVQCTHGASITDLDDEMVFYLQARGIGRTEARSLILAGWAREFVGKVSNDGAKQRVMAKAALLAPEDARRQTRVKSMASI